MQGRQREEDNCRPPLLQEATTVGRYPCQPTWLVYQWNFCESLLFFVNFVFMRVVKLCIFDNLVIMANFSGYDSNCLSLTGEAHWGSSDRPTSCFKECKLPIKTCRLLQGDQSWHLYQILLQKAPEILWRKHRGKEQIHSKGFPPKKWFGVWCETYTNQLAWRRLVGDDMFWKVWHFLALFVMVMRRMLPNWHWMRYAGVIQLKCFVLYYSLMLMLFVFAMRIDMLLLFGFGIGIDMLMLFCFGRGIDILMLFSWGKNNQG